LLFEKLKTTENRRGETYRINSLLKLLEQQRHFFASANSNQKRIGEAWMLYE